MAIAPDDVERTQQSDRDLVEAHRRGEPEAFDRIVAGHYRRLLAQAQGRLGDRAEAEDVVQEVFERAFKAFDRFGGEYRIGPWLSLITSHVCADHGTRRRVARELPFRIGLRDRVDETDPVDAVSDPVVLALVRSAIDGLPSAQRSTFMLREVGGLSYPQVADELGITEDNARARVHRARRTLQGKLRGVRETLAGVLAAPLAARSLSGRSSHRAAPGARPTSGVDLLSGATPALPVHPAGASTWTGLQQTAGQVAAQVVTGPVGQVVAMASAPAPRGSLLMGVMAGIAAATTVTMAAPGAATLPVSAAARPAASAPRPASGQFAPLLSSAFVPAPNTLATPETAHSGASAATPAPALRPTPASSATTVPTASVPPSATAAPASASPAPQSPAAPAAWPVIAAGVATGTRTTTGATSGGTVSPSGGSSTAATSPVVMASAAMCPWLSEYPGGAPGDLTTPPPLEGSPVALLSTGNVPSGTTIDTPTSPVIDAPATLTSTTSGIAPTTLSVLAGACLPPAQGALIVDLTAADGTEVQLHGALVSTLTDSSATGYLFRGTVIVLTESSSAALASAPLPWGLPGNFVAQLLVRRPAGTAQLSFEFLSSSPPASSQSGSPTGAATAPGTALSSSGGSVATTPQGSDVVVGKGSTGPTSSPAG